MNKKELVRRVATTMRDKNIRKLVSSKKQVFHISDDEGNSKDFTIKKSDKGVLFTIDDIEVVIDNIISVIEESIKQGEPISIHGFGTLGLHYRKARSTKHPDTGESVVVPARYIPKFDYGKDLRMCAKIYELSLDNIESEPEKTPDDNTEGGD